jgi:hypothetical protein
VHDGPVMSWDADRGIKNPSGSCPVNIHMRLYADSGDDALYSNTHGYMVFATAHNDVREGCSGTYWGDSDWAEHLFRVEYANRGYGTCADCWGFFNYEPERWDSGDPQHYWKNNGWTTAIAIP